MAVINVSAGSQAVLQLAPSADDLANVSANANVMAVPQMQDITINNSTGVSDLKLLTTLQKVQSQLQQLTN